MSSTAILGVYAIGILASLPVTFVPFHVLFEQAGFGAAFAASWNAFVAQHRRRCSSTPRRRWLLLGFGLVTMGIGAGRRAAAVGGVVVRGVEGHVRRARRADRRLIGPPATAVGARAEAAHRRRAAPRRCRPPSTRASERAAPAQAIDRFDGRGIALHQRLDGAVAAVAHPAVDARGTRRRRPSHRGSRRPARGRWMRSRRAIIASRAPRARQQQRGDRLGVGDLAAVERRQHLVDAQRARPRGTRRRRAAPRRASRPSARKNSIASVEYETQRCGRCRARVHVARRVAGLLDQLALRRSRAASSPGSSLPAGNSMNTRLQRIAELALDDQPPVRQHRHDQHRARDARCTRASPAPPSGRRTRSRRTCSSLPWNTRLGGDPRLDRCASSARVLALRPWISPSSQSFADQEIRGQRAPRACPARASSRSATSRPAAATSGSPRCGRSTAARTACRDPRPG